MPVDHSQPLIHGTVKLNIPLPHWLHMDWLVLVKCEDGTWRLFWQDDLEKE